MQIQTWQLFLFLSLFLGGGIALVVFFYKFKFRKIQNIVNALGWKSYLGGAQIPDEYKNYGKDIRRFASFEWVLEGEVGGKKIFFTQYLLSGATQYPYRYVAFSFFDEQISVVDVDRSYGMQFKQIFGNFGDFGLTERGMFFYHSTPWEMSTKNILAVASKLSQARDVLAKK